MTDEEWLADLRSLLERLAFAMMADHEECVASDCRICYDRRKNRKSWQVYRRARLANIPVRVPGPVLRCVDCQLRFPTFTGLCQHTIKAHHRGPHRSERVPVAA